MGKGLANWFGALAKRWQRQPDMKRDLVAFALLLGYNHAFGALQICDQLARRQFWKPLGNDMIHDYPLPPVMPGYMLPLEVGGHTEIDLPGAPHISLTHTAAEVMVRGEPRLCETITVQGLYKQDFVYQRSYPETGGVEIEARLGDQFRSLSAAQEKLVPEYLARLRQLARGQQPAAFQAA